MSISFKKIEEGVERLQGVQNSVSIPLLSCKRVNVAVGGEEYQNVTLHSIPIESLLYALGELPEAVREVIAQTIEVK